jgi:uncharacterized membrane protein YqaE (UPF0057 family)
MAARFQIKSAIDYGQRPTNDTRNRWRTRAVDLPCMPDLSNRRRTPVDLVRILIAILLPPLGVFLQVGIGGAFWLNILLTLLGYIPGIVHAVYIIAKR